MVDHWRGLVDMIFLFQTDPNTSLERENTNKLIQEPGRAMNPDFLRGLNMAYENTREQYADQFKQFCAIDTSKGSSTQLTTAFTVAKAIVDQMSRNAVDR